MKSTYVQFGVYNVNKNLFLWTPVLGKCWIGEAFEVPSIWLNFHVKLEEEGVMPANAVGIDFL